MQLFDLVFIASFLLVVAALIRIGWLALRRRRQLALRNLLFLVAFVVAYLAVVVVASLVSPQRVLQIGDTRCFDDWCISVEGAKTTSLLAGKVQPARGRFLLVTLRVSSRARRVRQSEPHTTVYLVDAAGNRYEISEAAQLALEAASGSQLPIGTMLDPGGSFSTVRVFDIPPDLSEIGLAVRQAVFGPGIFIIGDDASLFHKPSIFRIPLTSVQ